MVGIVASIVSSSTVWLAVRRRQVRTIIDNNIIIPSDLAEVDLERGFLIPRTYRGIPAPVPVPHTGRVQQVLRMRKFCSIANEIATREKLAPIFSRRRDR